MRHFIWIYLCIINVIAFAMYGIDKHKAKKGQWRIKEKELMLMAAIGGSAGALLGMRLFHHKTRKPLFAIGVRVLLVLQIMLLCYLHYQNHII